jgi:hypothetical protein
MKLSYGGGQMFPRNVRIVKAWLLAVFQIENTSTGHVVPSMLYRLAVKETEY